jgi:hypothetical protein
MNYKTAHIILFIFAFSYANWICAQENLNKNWDSEKIRGTRLIPTPNYTGFPLLNKGWLSGSIEFTSGEIADSLNLKYSSYKDEVIYYNSVIQTQIVIDKTSLNGFSFVGNDGKVHVFRKQFYDGFLKSYRYFEVLSDGETKLLVYRKVNLNTVPAYADSKGIMINMAYEPEYQYYFYSPEKKYVSVKLNRSDLLAKFEKEVQKPIKKLLRKNRISITDEASLLQAWKVIEKGGYKVVF